MSERIERAITIVRHFSDDPYVRLPRDTAQDSHIGWRALGMLTYMLSLPPDWIFYLSHLAGRREGHGNGRAAATAALKELQELGYLKIERARLAGRITGTVWHLSDLPIFQQNPGGTSIPPQVDFLNEENLKEEKQRLQIREGLQKKEKNNNRPRQNGRKAAQLPDDAVLVFADGSSCPCPLDWLVDLQAEVDAAAAAKTIKTDMGRWAAGTLRNWHYAGRPSSGRAVGEVKKTISAAQDAERVAAEAARQARVAAAGVSPPHASLLGKALRRAGGVRHAAAE